MSIFDYLVSKSTDEQERKPSSPTPYRKLSSALDTAAEEAKAQYPDDRETVNEFVKALKEICKTRCKRMPGVDPRPMKAAAHFFLSQDRMRAYACLLPPENEGNGITLEEFLDEMHYEGINYGVLQEEVQREFEYGYFHIFLAAQGTLPKAGENGKVTELFPRHEETPLEAQDGSRLDFSQGLQMQPIRKGAAICLIQLPIEGTDGSDVTGQALPCPRTDSARVPQGENTAISAGGRTLTASVDGILYSKDGLFYVREQRIVDGDLSRPQDTVKASGDLYIAGNVDGGAVVEASGDIVINGKLGAARVTSVGGSIRVQQGVCGTEGGTFLNAAHQVQSPVMERAEINAGTSVIAEVILNSTIHCDGTVYAMTGRGMITGSLIRTGDSILCLRVGNLAGERNRFSVGYPPHSPESWNQLKDELAEVKSTIKMLWTAITDLRKKGARISDAEKSVLDRLVEQRDLYIDRRESLTVELGILEQVLDKKSCGRVQCETLYPFLDIQIGRFTQEITTTEENCNIHVVNSRIMLK